MSFGSIDFEDLGSFDGSGSDHGMRSPRSILSTICNPVGLTIGGTDHLASPNRSIASSGAGSYAIARNHSHSVHGVHMHVQENAKVPLLNEPVDRSNSNPNPSAQPSVGDNGFSLAEFFLSKESNHRQSLNRNYAGIGASFLEDTVGTGVRNTSEGHVRRPSWSARISGEDEFKDECGIGAGTTVDDETQLEIDALAAAIDPTPWSEIERRINTQQSAPADLSSQHHHHQQQQQTQKRASYTTNYTTGSLAPRYNNYNNYSYGRAEQLPIPERMPSPPHQAIAPPSLRINESAADMAQAVATAAALASVGTPPVESIPKIPPASNVASLASLPPGRQPHGHTSHYIGPYTKEQQTPHGGSKPPHTQPYQRRAPYSPPTHAEAHATSRASVLAAADQQSQYGFGGNHVVTSVPAPPPSTSTRQYSRTGKPIPVLVVPPPPPSSTEDASHHSGVAYERKKQRAKDSRIRLNDAIERLSIAMSLAGSQSTQRVNLLTARISKTEQRAKSIQISEECALLANTAKKWDRPSFVGSAASIVQALNSQCESLAREMVYLQQRLDVTSGGGSGNVYYPSVHGQEMALDPDHKRQEPPMVTEAPPMNGYPVKRMKCENGNDSGIIHGDVAADEKTIFGNVVKMLDPVSLSRCPCVSKRWRDMDVFDDNSTWLQLAVKRFGFFNVRQWTEKLEDGEAVSNKVLYRAMNAANVMPHMQQDGLAFLGDAKVPGRISAWVFMVERSNGETLRSVKREPSVVAPGAGAYQSRPVVELHMVIQNTGMSHYPIVIKSQQISVDVSTRRSGGEFQEIFWDDRFSKVVKNVDGSIYQGRERNQSRFDVDLELCRLGLFEVAIINIHVDAKGCSTTSRFRQRSNFTKVLVSLEGTTIPIVIPFLRDASQGH